MQHCSGVDLELAGCPMVFLYILVSVEDIANIAENSQIRRLATSVVDPNQKLKIETWKLGGRRLSSGSTNEGGLATWCRGVIPCLSQLSCYNSTFNASILKRKF